MAAFARAQGHLSGRFRLAEMGRLIQDASAPAAEEDVVWSAEGELRASAGAPVGIYLHLRAATRVLMTCQRCLQAKVVALDVRRSLRFVQGEDVAARIDEDSEEDVLALSATLDLHDLIEDELILALPLVPRHDDCTLPLSPERNVASSAESPFAALAALRPARDDPD